MRAACGIAVLAFVMVAAGAQAADAPRLRLPIDCRMGKDCYIQKYVDHDPNAGSSDYRCGPLTDDGHRGTDFRLRDFADLDRDVAVLAAADGTVGPTRDGMPDVHARLVGKPAVTERGLGNVVTIDHGGGWRTIYAHLRRGSLTVKSGDTVKAGDKIGVVGLSGLTEFPHVHFAVEYRGRAVDPFVGSAPRVGCGDTRSTLWRPGAAAKLAYVPSFTMRAGLSDRPMTRAALQYGLYERTEIARKGGRLFFGILIGGLYQGDEFRFRLIDANGKTRRDLNRVESRRWVVQFYKAELKRIGQLPAGEYTALFTLTGIRDGKRGVVLEESQALTLR